MSAALLSKYLLRKWSVSVRWRDRRCRICGSREKLEAHHLFSKSYHPELAYDIANGVALCGDNKKDGNRCHIAFHTKFKRSSRQDCSPAEFDRFVRLIQWAHGFAGQNKDDEPETPEQPAP